MKKFYTTLLVPALLLVAGTLVAGEAAGQSPQDEATRAESQVMLEEAEKARADAKMARQEASKAAAMAREMSQRHAQAAHKDSVGAQRDHEEVARAREELSRAHRELREASREVAQAHRDLSRSGRDVEINLGDRAVIGVVLGKQTDQGVEIIGVSPDGPAERAGLQPGDVLVSIRGEELAGDNEARQSIFQVMHDVSDGEELPVVVNRSGKSFEYTVTAEQREPRGWQSVIRIKDIDEIPEVPNAPHVIMETIEIPEIDRKSVV